MCTRTQPRRLALIGAVGALADGRRAPDYVLAGAPAALAALRPLLGGRTRSP